MSEQYLTEFSVSRLDNESDKAWAAFKQYCELGENRSLKELHKHFCGDERATKGNQKSPPTKSKAMLKKWSSRFNWAQRAAEYDAIRESDRLKILEQETKQQWRQEIEAYRDRNRRAGAASFELAIVQIRKCTEAIQNAEFTADQAIRAVSGIARLIEVSQATEGTALGIDQLLRELN